MSWLNKRISGGARRKNAAEKQEKQNKILAATPKSTTFHRKKEINEENLGSPTSPDSTISSDVDPDEGAYNMEIDMGEEEGEEGITPEVDLSKRFSSDPASWDYRDNELITFVTSSSRKFDPKTRNFRESETGQRGSLLQEANKPREKNRDWLEFSYQEGSLYCVPCFFFGKERKSGKSALAGPKGFRDWKNAHKALSDHERSPEHSHSISTFANRCNSKGKIDADFIRQEEIDREYWREFLRKAVTVIKFLSSRGLAFRGSNQKLGSAQNGNYLGLLELLAQHDVFLAKHLATYGNKGKGNTSYISANICETFIQLLAEKLESFIVDELKEAKYYSIIVDSTPDVSHTDQLCFVVRYVLPDGAPVERFLGFLPMHGHTAENMFNMVSVMLKRLGISIKDLRGQSYDNASNMSGIYNGLQAKIKALNHLADYVPCGGHSLNLTGTSAAESCATAFEFFKLLQELYNFLSGSTHRWAVLLDVLQKSKKKIKTSSLKVPKSLSQTRWSARAEAAIAVKEGYNEYKSALKAIGDDSTQAKRTRAEANGIIAKFEKLETAVLTVIWATVLERVNKVNKQLQSVSIDLGIVVELFTSLVEFIEEVRSNYACYEEEAAKLVGMEIGSLVYSADERRQRIRKRHHDEIDSAADTAFTGRNKMISEINIMLDHLSAELRRRQQVYSQLNDRFGFITNLFDLDAALITLQAKKLVEHFSDDIEQCFPNECLQFKSFVPLFIGDGPKKRKPTALDLLKIIKEKELHSTFPNVDVALRIFLSKAVTNCSGERSFSTLKRIKNFQRPTMVQERLSSLALLQIENDLLNSIDVESVINSFAALKCR